VGGLFLVLSSFLRDRFWTPVRVTVFNDCELSATMRLLLVAVITIALLWPTCVAEVQLQNVYSYLGRGFDLVTGKNDTGYYFLLIITYIIGDLRPTSQNDGK